jgi:hypothetical protein
MNSSGFTGEPKPREGDGGEEIILTDRAERQYEQGNATLRQARGMSGLLAVEHAADMPDDQPETAGPHPVPSSTARQQRKPRTSREKAWADQRSDLKPFPYGTKED